MSIQGHLEEREAGADRARQQDQRDADALEWFNRDNPPEARLLKFDSWARRQLAKRLDWTWAGAAKEKRIEQCRIQLNTVVRHLFKRGWMFDSERLAARITDLLDTVAKAQAKGGIRDFWPYFKASVDRYVGANAEELREEAMQAGVHAGQVFQALRKSLPAVVSVPELEAQRAQETLREKLSKERRKGRRTDDSSDQLELL